MEEELELLMIETKDAMDKSLVSLGNEFALIRSGRANPIILKNIKIKYYGTDTPLSQLSTVNVVEGNQLYIKPFDKGIIKDIEVAINESDLNIPPVNDGVAIRLILPKLTEERRKETVKEVEKKAEMTKVIIRNHRREANDKVKKLALPEDLEHFALDDIQKMTDEYISKIDKASLDKKNEVLKI